jgi:YbbR domain-containing protein
VNLSPAAVNVAITVVGVDASRTSSVVLGAITGTASGAFISAITYSPMTVVLQGSQDIINGASLATVTTGGIDVAGQTGTVTYKVPIETPTGISASPATAAVTITVSLLPTPTPAAASPTASSGAPT